MKFEKFSNGENFTLGLELEVRILDKFDLTPCNEYEYIFQNINPKYKDNITPEFLSSMIEINSPIFYENKNLISFLKEITNDLKEIAKEKDLCIQTSGSFAQKSSNIKINSNNRYEKLYEEHQVLLDDFTICGTHIHVGFEDSNKALKAYNYALYYLPLFVALSASSAFYDSINTGIHSYRTKIFERLPKASIPEYFETYEKMQDLYDLLNKSNVINSTKDIWWDIRIQPHFKTIEFRICDAINDFERLEVIIDLLKVICKLSQIEKAIKMPMQVLKQNMWSATRYSMSGNMVTNNGLETIRNVLSSIIIKAENNCLLTKESIQKAKELIEKKSIAQEMQELYKKTKNLKDIDNLGVFK